jgi:hypothetical protein
MPDSPTPEQDASRLPGQSQQEAPPTPAASESATSPSVTPPSANVTEFNIGDEFGTAKRNLPPGRIVAAAIAAVAVVLGIFAFVQRPKPAGGGSIDFVARAEVPGQQSILVAITFTLRNSSARSLWIHSLKAQLKTADGQDHEDEAASAVDLDRYYAAFPALKESSGPPLPPETKIAPGATQNGTIVVSFPISKDAFDGRKSLQVVIQLYDQQLPMVLK